MLSDPPKVFISYSHADEAWKDRLVKQLEVLQVEDVFEVWDDRRIANRRPRRCLPLYRNRPQTRRLNRLRTPRPGGGVAGVPPRNAVLAT